ncbi:protein kinase domain-containing protein [Embleya sp. MST-111070]|uniref:protein kinase domain-containing protein n=1 Tax=Embleya sp. MST-111070 TaxID=3398231 RepID=UPI003F737CB8
MPRMDQPAPPPLDVPTGLVVADWRVIEPIGSGSWGSVYAAERTSDGTPVAIKFLRTDLLTPGQRSSMDELVHREVHFSRTANHPNLVRTHAVVTVDDPDHPELRSVVGLVMDRAARSLRDVLDSAESGLEVPGAGRILRGVAAGLAHMHEHGRVHGDLKPANTLLSATGDVWLADFGLTAELDGTHAYIPPLGSLDHVPPEWWSERTGERGTVIRPTADVWAFGVLAHQVLTGGLHPFVGSNARARALAAQAYARGVNPLRLDDRVPQEWRRLITECLAPDHESRSRLDAAEIDERVRALSGATRPRRRRLVAALVVAGVALAGVGVGLGLRGDGDPRAEAAPSAAASRPAAATGTPAPTAVPRRIAGDVPAGSDVPAELRPMIADAAQRCTEAEVTPALLAAMLKAESGFDARAARPESDEYGIAMWTPRVFNAWAVDGDRDGRKDYMSPPDAIATMGVYVCWLAQHIKQEGMREDVPALTVAAYRTSDRTVREARSVPPRTRAHVDLVLRYLAEYTGTPPAPSAPAAPSG